MAYTSGHVERAALQAYLESTPLTDADKITLVELAHAILRDAAAGWPDDDQEADDAENDVDVVVRFRTECERDAFRDAEHADTRAVELAMAQHPIGSEAYADLLRDLCEVAAAHYPDGADDDDGPGPIITPDAQATLAQRPLPLEAERAAAMRQLLHDAEQRAYDLFDASDTWAGEEAFRDLRALAPEISDDQWAALVATNFEKARRIVIS